MELPDTWAYGAGVLHGGWLLESLAAAALEHTAHPHPLAVSAHFAAAPRVGEGDVTVEVLREGRSVSSLRTRLAQEGAVKVEALISCGTLPGPATGPLVQDGAPPVLPRRDACVRNALQDGLPRNGIIEQLEVLLDPASAGWLSGPPGGGSEVRAWVRAVDGREPDPLQLITVADALPPVTLDLGIPGWVPTVELTVHLRALPAPGWLRCVQRARLVQGGWLDEECEVWDSQDRLVVQARQLAAYREAS